MSSPTDSELRDRWEKAKARLNLLKKRKESDANNQEMTEVQRELDLVAVEWAALVERKRQGVLTDPSEVALVKRIAEELTLFSGMKFKVRDYEGDKDSSDLPVFWIVEARFCGAISEFVSDRFMAIGEKATAKIMEADPLLLFEWHQIDVYRLNRSGDEMMASMLKRTDPTSPGAYHRIEANETSPAILWAVDPWIWDGPKPVRAGTFWPPVRG